MFKNTANAAYTGSAVAGIIGSLNWGDLGAIFGILFGLITLLINWYYKRKEDARAEKAMRYLQNKEAKGKNEQVKTN